MSRLVLGPLLRYVSETEATVWVETERALRGRGARPQRADLLGRRATTTRWSGSRALSRAASTSTRSRSTGSAAWPPRRLTTCRRARSAPSAPARRSTSASAPAGLPLPHEPPYTQTKDEDPRGLRARRPPRPRHARWRAGSASEWPELLFLLGDQVYVDEGSPRTRERIRAPPRHREAARRGGDRLRGVHLALRGELERPADPLAVLDRLDLDGLGRPRHERRLEHLALLARGDGRKEWWHERAVDGIASYWIYQHLGNLSPRELDENELYAKVRGNPDATGCCASWAKEIDTTAAGTRWSFCRDFDGVRAIFIDSRAARVLTRGPALDVRRRRVWDWIVDHASGDFDHLLLATTVPVPALPRLPPPRGLERARSATAPGAGRSRARSEQLRRAVDFDHWASFQYSFRRLRELLEEVGSGRRGKPPASIVAPLRRRPPRLPLRRRLQARRRRPERRLPGGLLALPQPARRQRATRGPGRLLAPLRRAGPRPGPPRRRPRPRHPLAPARGPVLRQPGRRPSASTAARRRCASTRRSPARKMSAGSRRRSSVVWPEVGWGGRHPAKAHPAPRPFRRLQIPLRRRRPGSRGESRPRGRRTAGHHR